MDFFLIGLGLKPDCCGQQLGSSLVVLIKNQCYLMDSFKTLRLEVRSFNRRAIKCYEKAGFKIISHHERVMLLGVGDFITMERQPSLEND